MKKTVNINLNGIVFNIDEDAYALLSKYLYTLEKHLAGEAERQEIIKDVEARIAELLNEKLTGYRQVVTIDDVNQVIEVMGQPNDFGGNDNTGYQQQTYTTYRRYRRMYRDPDNRVIGGVCSGLGAYWAMDPTILRILFIVAFFGAGVGLLVYLVLWVVLPEARTTAQKLEMRGEPVTISNMVNFVKEEFEHVKNNFSKSKKP
ncbi:MAG: PspC domain-containing protein [Bacteroidota bacterium]